MREQVRQRNPQAFQEKIEKQTSTQGAITNRLHKRGCHCKKSHCKKKYCECFQACLWRSSGRLLAQLLCWVLSHCSGLPDANRGSTRLHAGSQAGVNCGVHCKCDECHNTVEDGLPPPTRSSAKQAVQQAAAVHAPAQTADSTKTSPGTPPAL